MTPDTLRSDVLDGLLAGTLRWLGSNLHFFPENMQATFELAILCRCWARSRPADVRLDEASSLLRDLWQQPWFQEKIIAHPVHAYLYELLYAALAPAGVQVQTAGIPRTRPRHESAKLPAEHLAYLRLEARYYSDLAGIAQDAAPYPELYKSTILGYVRDAHEVPEDGAYLAAHIAFYLGDFGQRVPPLDPGDLDHAAAVAADLLERCVRSGHNWDLASELVLAQFCLGGDPLRTTVGQSAITALAAAQLADGSLPRRSPDQSQGSSAAESFRKRYHPTLAATLMAALVPARRAIT
jgi:hypothetical protein